MKKIMTLMLSVIMAATMLTVPVFTEDAKQPPTDITVSYDSERGLVVSSADVEWLSGIAKDNYGIIVTDGTRSETIVKEWIECTQSEAVVKTEYLRSNLHLFNGSYPITILSEGYYQSNASFEMNDTISTSTVIEVTDGKIKISSADTAYLNKLITDAVVYYAVGDNNLGYGLTLADEADTADDGSLTFVIPDLPAASYTAYVYLQGYDLVSFDLTVEKATSDFKAVVDTSGNIILSIAEGSSKSFFADLQQELTVPNRAQRKVGRLQFEKDGRTYIYSRSVMGGSPSGAPYYITDSINETLTIPTEYLAKMGISKGEYKVTFVNQNNEIFDLGKLTLIHEDLPTPDDLKIEYDLNKEALIISTNDSDYLLNIQEFILTKGADIYAVYVIGEESTAGKLAIDYNTMTASVSREYLGTLLSKNGLNNPLYAGTYSVSLYSVGYVKISASSADENRFVDILPALKKNKEPFNSDDYTGNHKLACDDDSRDHLHNHLHGWAKRLFNEDYENDGSCSTRAEEALKGAKISSEITTEIVADSEVKDEDRKLIEDNKGDKAISNVFDLSICLVIDGERDEEATINEIDEPISYTVDVSKETVPEGYDREYYIERVHNGKHETLKATDNGDGTISFDSDLYSTYALTYKDTKQYTPTPTPTATPQSTLTPKPSATPESTPKPAVTTTSTPQSTLEPVQDIVNTSDSAHIYTWLLLGCISLYFFMQLKKKEA